MSSVSKYIIAIYVNVKIYVEMFSLFIPGEFADT